MSPASGSSQSMTLDASGNLGIGIATPQRNIHLHDPASTSTKIQITNGATGSSTDGDGFQLGIGNDGTAYLEQRENVPMVFTTNNTEAMRIDSSGTMGIGTSSAGSWTKLEVAGTGGLQNGATQALHVSSPSATVNEGVGIRLNAGSGSHEAIGIIGMVNNASGNFGSMTFHAYSGGAYITERMRIDSSGNVGIGVTPETDWHSGADALQLGTGASIYGDTTATGNPLMWGANARQTSGWGGTANWNRIATEQATMYQSGDGKHTFYVAPSGSADSAISWTNAMTINNTGNVGINTASPSSGYMLHVGGSSGVHTKVKIEATTATGQAELDLTADPAGVSYLNLGDENSYNIGQLGYFHSDNSMRFRVNAAERMRIDAAGIVTKPYQPAF